MSSIAGPALFACFVVAQFAAVVVIGRMNSADGARTEDGARRSKHTAREPISSERGHVVSPASRRVMRLGLSASLK
jgi:hypothetical protein